jgi:hypothetical protein
LTPDHQHKERETTHNTNSPDESIENHEEVLSKFDEVLSCCELPKLYDNEDGELIVLVTCVGILVDVTTVLSLLTIVKLLNKLSLCTAVEL